MKLRKGKYEKLMELAKRRGFFWPAYELYGGIGGLLDMGPLGSSLKRKIEEKWRSFFSKQVKFLELETPIVAPGDVFKASGHVDHFMDKMSECARCKRRWRIDHLVKEQTGLDVEGLGPAQVDEVIKERGVRCPECNGELLSTRPFNLMFKTAIGPYTDRLDFMRPETAQAMFIDFKRLYELARRKLPFAAAQIGRCLRNEISPRQGPIRLREFTIMEFEFFFDPEDPSCPFLEGVKGEKLTLVPAKRKERDLTNAIEITVERSISEGYIATEWQAYFMVASMKFVESLGIPRDVQRFDEKMPWERAHYAVQTYDHEVLLERWGWIEVAGISYRTDYDLKVHMSMTKSDMRVKKDGRYITPHVVEPSYGSDRLLYATLEYAYSEREGRVVLKLPRDVSPIQAVVLPLVTKDGLPEVAKKVYEGLKEEGFMVEYDDSGFIGRRYARFDEVGVPLAITIDYQTLKDGTVTLRDRDTWEQVRVRTERIASLLKDYLAGKLNFKGLAN
jgi:glycyl-tRNA synthetase